MTGPLPLPSPEEWVEGDPGRAARRAIVVTTLTVANAVPAFTTAFLAFDGVALGNAAAAGILLAQGVLLAGLLVAARRFGLDRYPAVARLGISPDGLRVRIPGTFEWRFPWSKVLGVGPDFVDLSPSFLTAKRLRLTERQASRLREHLGRQGGPAPASGG